LNLPDLNGVQKTGFVHFCCWPCVCDAHDWLKVDPTEIETSEGKRTFNFLVIGNPCQDSGVIPASAPDVTCVDGKLEKATYSTNGYAIVGMLQDYDTSKHSTDENEVLGGGTLSKCESRAQDGYHSGMGQIFREVAAIDVPKSGMEVKLSKAETKEAKQQYCNVGGAYNEYQTLLQKAQSNAVLLAGAVYRGTNHYRCYDAAEEKLQQEGVCHATMDISDELWGYLKCLYPNEVTSNRMMMHSYLYIGGEMVGNGFVLDEYMDRRYTWAQMEQKMQNAGAAFTCKLDCDSLLDAEQLAELNEAIAEQPIVLYGWEGCPCVAMARERFASRHACFVENTWTNPQDSKMKYLQCKYGDEHHSFIWFNEKKADGSMAGGTFLGNGFYLGKDKMSDSQFEGLLAKSGDRQECAGTEDRSLLGGELESCTDENDRTTTGFTRSGSCVWQANDGGYHQVCVRMSNQFIAQSARIDHNDLSSVTGENQHWCICAWAWASAVTRDPENYEGIHLECGRTNKRLRDVYQLHIDSGREICSPGNVCYKAEKALEAVNKLCPEEGAFELKSPQKRIQKHESEQIKPYSPKNDYYLEPILAFAFAICLTFGILKKHTGRDAFKLS